MCVAACFTGVAYLYASALTHIHATLTVGVLQRWALTGSTTYLVRRGTTLVAVDGKNKTYDMLHQRHA